MDNLEELEKLILEYNLIKGYELGIGSWGFKVYIESYYKNKTLIVSFFDGKEVSLLYKTNKYTVTSMFEEAIKHFKGLINDKY